MRYLEKSLRATWSEINIPYLRFNYHQLEQFAGADVDIMAVVKANAYGHGLLEVSREFLRLGVKYLGVATLDEALLIRRQIKSAQIMVLGTLMPDEVKSAIRHNITMTLCDESVYRKIIQIAARKNIRAKVHVLIDTGMGRIGLWHEEAFDVIKRWAKNSSLDIEGVHTHFAAAARDKAYTEYQIDSFNALIDRLKGEEITFKYRHAANSVATLGFKASHFNLIRPGIMLYGIYPKAGFRGKIKLKSVLSLRTKVVFIKDVPPGRSISYGRTHITKKHTRIATIPIGYADGYGRILSNKAQVLVHGKRAPVVGMVTMDQVMIDVGHIPGVKVGSVVTLIGKDKKSVLTAEKLSRMAGTIPYEILCSISNRVPRKYIR